MGKVFRLTWELNLLLPCFGLLTSNSRIYSILIQPAGLASLNHRTIRQWIFRCNLKEKKRRPPIFSHLAVLFIYGVPVQADLQGGYGGKGHTVGAVALVPHNSLPAWTDTRLAKKYWETYQMSMNLCWLFSTIIKLTFYRYMTVTLSTNIYGKLNCFRIFSIRAAINQS